jgi:hypothetical protein
VLPVFSEDLAAEVGRRYGAPEQIMQLNYGIFDEAPMTITREFMAPSLVPVALRSDRAYSFTPDLSPRRTGDFHRSGREAESFTSLQILPS